MILWAVAGQARVIVVVGILKGVTLVTEEAQTHGLMVRKWRTDATGFWWVLRMSAE